VTRIRKPLLLTIAALSLAIGADRALAGPGCGGGRGGGMMGGHGRADMIFPMLLRAAGPTPEQEAKVAEIMRRHRGNLEPLFKQLHAAHRDLAAKLLAPGAVTAADVAPAVQQLGQVRQQLMQEWVQAALEARAVLTPDQLAKASEVKKRLDSLHAEIEKLLGPLPMPPADDTND
jgi:Spy/CpxP family protein refolding chaperone